MGIILVTREVALKDSVQYYKWHKGQFENKHVASEYKKKILAGKRLSIVREDNENIEIKILRLGGYTNQGNDMWAKTLK